MIYFDVILIQHIALSTEVIFFYGKGISNNASQIWAG